MSVISNDLSTNYAQRHMDYNVNVEWRNQSIGKLIGRNGSHGEGKEPLASILLNQGPATLRVLRDSVKKR
jgi:ABC-type Mn2+/Zn2+ transport system ATPase subunit